jgi:hypothetical protein
VINEYDGQKGCNVPGQGQVQMPIPSKLSRQELCYRLARHDIANWKSQSFQTVDRFEQRVSASISAELHAAEDAMEIQAGYFSMHRNSSRGVQVYPPILDDDYLEFNIKYVDGTVSYVRMIIPMHILTRENAAVYEVHSS